VALVSSVLTLAPPFEDSQNFVQVWDVFHLQALDLLAGSPSMLALLLSCPHFGGQSLLYSAIRVMAMEHRTGNKACGYI
jgi:hypothetical protein